MTSFFRKHRQSLTAGILAVLVAAWVLPAQACFAETSQATTPIHCPDCPCSPDGACGSAVAACAASMQPSAIAAAPSLDKALPAAIVIRLPASQWEPVTVGLQPPPQAPDRSSSTELNIRYCTFQE